MTHVYSFPLFLCAVLYSFFLGLSSVSFIFPSFPRNVENFSISLKSTQILHNSHLGAQNQSLVCITLLRRETGGFSLHSSTNSQHERKLDSKAGLTHTCSGSSMLTSQQYHLPSPSLLPMLCISNTLLTQSRDFQKIQILLLNLIRKKNRALHFSGKKIIHFLFRIIWQIYCIVPVHCSGWTQGQPLPVTAFFSLLRKNLNYNVSRYSEIAYKEVTPLCPKNKDYPSDVSGRKGTGADQVIPGNTGLMASLQDGQ